MLSRYAADDDPEDLSMYGGYDDGDSDIDIDGRDSNGNFVGGYGSCYEQGFGGYGSPTSPVEHFYSEHSKESSDRNSSRNTAFSALYGGYKYQFNTEEELITSEVFQRCLGQALAHKDRTIRELQDELMEIFVAHGGIL